MSADKRFRLSLDWLAFLSALGVGLIIRFGIVPHIPW